MANTTIQLKYSTSTGNVPSSLANGELAINSADGKVFYRTPAGAINSIVGYPGPSGLNTEIQFNDNGTLGANSSLTFNKSTGTFSTNIASVSQLVVDNLSVTDTSVVTTTTTNATTLASFASATYGSGKFLIQATQGTSRQITEILVVHNGTTADATEYGTIITNSALFSVEVSLSGGVVSIMVTTTTSTSTTYKTSYTLLTV